MDGHIPCDTHALPIDSLTPTSCYDIGRGRSSIPYSREVLTDPGQQYLTDETSGHSGLGVSTANHSVSSASSRGSSPSRFHIQVAPLSSSGGFTTPPSFHKATLNLKKTSDPSSSSGSGNAGRTAGSSPSSGIISSSGRKRSPVPARRITPVGADAGGPLTPQQGRTRIVADDENVAGGQAAAVDDIDVENIFSSGVSSGSGEALDSILLRIENTDDADGSHTPSAQQRTREVVEHLQAKVQRTKDLIKECQQIRDANVNEYLKLSSNANKTQLARIKAVFEKKNQKSAVSIQQLQKKLENYQKRLKEIETHGVASTYRQPKEVLRDMGQGLKSGLISKPKEIAHLIKNKFGSADNIKELANEEEKDEEKTHHGSATLPPGSGLLPITSSSTTVSVHTAVAAPVASYGATRTTGSGSGPHESKIGSEEASECSSSVTSESNPGIAQYQLSSPKALGLDYAPLSAFPVDNFMQMLQERCDENVRLKAEIDTIKQSFQSEVNHLRECLTEERFRSERLEEQVNDLIELHQNEMENLKTSITDMEEKVQYQSEERIRDLHEVVENCQTRISRMEHQQAQQQQQFLTLEGLENSNARIIFVKLINVLLTVLQVLLLVVATLANILTPLLQTRTRLVTTTIFVFFVLTVYMRFPELQDAWLAFLESRGHIRS